MRENELRSFIQDKLTEDYNVITTKTRNNGHAALWAIVHPGGKFLVTIEKIVGKSNVPEADNE